MLFKHKLKKNGAPKIEVITPAGNSEGAIKTLANVSASKGKIAPKIILKGIKTLAFAPSIFLTMWGAIKPTKLIVPPAQTAQETHKAPAIKTTIRNLSTSTPKDIADFSPPESKSKDGAILKISTKDKIAGIIKKESSFQPRPLKLPKIQV